MEPSTPEEYFDGDPLGLAVCARVLGSVAGTFPDVTVRVSRSQVALRRRRGFAFLWDPSRPLRRSTGSVVLSLALDVRLDSPRFKEVVHPGPWMHHLEVRSVAEVDEEVLGWLRLAAAGAG